MIGMNGYPGYQMQTAYPQTYRQTYQPPQPMQAMQPQMDPGQVNARYVTCREEAVAAQIIPDGNPYYFVNEAQGRIYSKRFNPQLNAPEFKEYVLVQQQNPNEPQYAPLEAVKALMNRVEQIEQALTAPARKEMASE